MLNVPLHDVDNNNFMHWVAVTYQNVTDYWKSTLWIMLRLQALTLTIVKLKISDYELDRYVCLGERGTVKGWICLPGWEWNTGATSVEILKQKLKVHSPICPKFSFLFHVKNYTSKCEFKTLVKRAKLFK